MNISIHAQQRLQQRGLSESDIDLILTHGTETHDGYYLRHKDVKEVELELRKVINRLARLAGKFVVVKGDTVVSAYHPGKKKGKKVLYN